ncbi:type III-B CRISPR-associated protein Cas10/Cmr2 [Microcoleus sp. ARI1-B5]|uniref:type III-B CRISPR-associated protein Cas10/Cmr2 n=1 Tax=unclassified Microcoleus TaxID=2642155 RepID=UPI002FCF38CA
MSEFWKAKIWGLLHDPVLKALHFNTGRGGNSFWQDLAVMQEWRENNWNPEESTGTALKHIHLADYITSASDRAAIGSLSESINYAPKNNSDKGLELFHLLSSEPLDFKLSQHENLIKASNRANYLNEIEQSLFQQQIIDPDDNQPKPIREISHPQKVFWWLWRCLPVEVCRQFGNDESLLLMPAETRIPDASIWSHASLTAALAGALAGYGLTSDQIKRWPANKNASRPYIAIFSFTPIQELIKASRKMRDFWAGSWILHYLSAKVCWKLAQLYGPDSLVYPCLFQQPLIDAWLLQQWPDFDNWIDSSPPKKILTAGFPNVLVLVLPDDRVKEAMQEAKQILLQEWHNLGHLVFEELNGNRQWMPDLEENSKTWKDWLGAQWQTYWTAVPLGDIEKQLKSSEIYQDDREENQQWRNAQNLLCNLDKKRQLFLTEELNFLQAAAKLRKEKQNRYPFSANVGSWWPYLFDQTRFALSSIKSARTWKIPTAFGDRSTISGLGPAVHPDNFGGRKDWVTEAQTKALWQRRVGFFDGNEKLNSAETVKRCLHKVLPQLFQFSEDDIAASYPDLTAGVAGYLKVHPEGKQHFEDACDAILKQFDWAKQVIREMRGKWGIPWADAGSQKYHPRLLNAGWLIEDAEAENREQLRVNVQNLIDSYYPNNNPADWYVIAAGDGDGMSDWLKGKNLGNYGDFIPQELRTKLNKSLETKKLAELEMEVRQTFQTFLEQPKRMGPSTHSALSRALLDFSNQLVPYLTEQRYAGRLIYGGGDDVLAYTNLWEWDKWLWDIRECFRGVDDPHDEFERRGDYWQWKDEKTLPQNLARRPLFTMGSKATISFGIVIAHHSVPLAIALENIWQAEAEAKEHISPDRRKKDAVQVRVLYGNGNILKATCKFEVFRQWQLLTAIPDLDSAIFEQAATVWSQHPAPMSEAIAPWSQAFCSRREQLVDDSDRLFQQKLSEFLQALWKTTVEDKLTQEIYNWLKLAAFVIRKRQIN